MKQQDLVVGESYAVEAGSPRRLVTATVLGTGLRIGRTAAGVRVRWGAGHPFQDAGSIQVVQSRRVMHQWGSEDERREAAAAADAAIVSSTERRLAELGIVTAFEHHEIKRAADRDAQIEARRRGDENWMLVEAEHVSDHHYASVGISKVTMPRATLELLLDHIERNTTKGKR